MNKRLETSELESARNQNKETVSIRLSTDVVEVMDEAFFYARKEFSRNTGNRLTKSEFYEFILRELSNEYKSKDKDSLLWRSVLVRNRK